MGGNRLYKDTAGFSQIGGKRESDRFYSDSYDAGHPGFCAPFCASVSAIYIDPLADLEYGLVKLTIMELKQRRLELTGTEMRTAKNSI